MLAQRLPCLWQQNPCAFESKAHLLFDGQSDAQHVLAIPEKEDILSMCWPCCLVAAGDPQLIGQLH